MYLKHKGPPVNKKRHVLFKNAISLFLVNRLSFEIFNHAGKKEKDQNSFTNESNKNTMSNQMSSR